MEPRSGVILKQERRLSQRGILRVADHMPIRHKNVFVSVAIEIKEDSSPADRPSNG